MADNIDKADILKMTVDIAAAHLGHNSVPSADIPHLISEIYKSLASTEAGKPPSKAPEPIVPVKKSVTPDHVICLEDGEKLKMLKRHLTTAHGMTIAEYRERWGLPGDYPMVAPNYTKRRSALAKHIGLGTKHARRRGAKK